MTFSPRDLARSGVDPEQQLAFEPVLDVLTEGAAINVGSERVYANDAFVKIYGLASREEALSLPAGSAWMPEDSVRLRSYLEAARAGKPQPGWTEVRIRRPDGSIGTVETKVIPIRYHAQRASLVLVHDVTEQREYLRRFESLVENLAEGVVVVSEGRRVFMNPAFMKIHGYPSVDAGLLDGPSVVLDLADEIADTSLVGSSTAHEVWPSDRERVSRILGEVAHGGVQSGEIEYRVRLRDGTTKTLELTSTRIEWAGAPAVMSVVRDVTDLRDTEGRFETMVSSLSESVNINANGQRLFVNPAFVELFGYSTEREAIKPAPFWAIVDEDRPLVAEYERQVRTSDGRAPRIEYRIRRTDGTLRTVLGAATRVRYRGTDATLWLAHDVTELREAELRFQAMVENLAEGVEVIVGDRRLFANAAWARVHGLDSVERALASPVNGRNILAPDRKQAVEDREAVLQRKKHSSFNTYRILLPDGQVKTLERTIVALDLGSTPAVLGVIHDVTARARAEEELRNLNESLEQMVSDRTRELQSANEELESFSYSVSHDLRAPLRAMEGFSAAIAEDYRERLDDEGRELLSRIQAAANRMAQLIDDLLALSRLTRSDMEFRPVALGALAEQIIEELRAAGPTREVDVEVNDMPDPVGDERLMRVALQNLLGNAWKFTARNHNARIRVGCEAIDGRNVYFVQDNGVGFSMAYVDKVFAPFQRLHSQSDFPGSGIGLASAARVVHRHGGEIWADAKEDEGATFYFTLQDGRR